MDSQFKQPKQVINIEVNKQCFACDFGFGDTEVCYVKTGQPLTGYKAIYDRLSQRAYALPTGLTGTVTSLSTAGALITMDITDAIQTAVPAGTRIRATYPLTTRPALPTS